MKKMAKFTALVVMLLVVTLLAGCGGGASVKRINGLAPTEVVQTFFNAVKNNSIGEAVAYVTPDSRSDAKAVMNLGSLSDLKKYNLFSVKEVAREGNYAVVVATLQEQGSVKFSVKPVGLEKLNGEWYLVDFDSIYTDAKYKALEALMSRI